MYDKDNNSICFSDRDRNKILMIVCDFAQKPLLLRVQGHCTNDANCFIFLVAKHAVH